MVALRKEVKVFIVRSLALFNTPEETAKLVNEKYPQIKVTRQQCERYDPTKKAGQDLSQELQDRFFEYRRKANEEIEAIPLANKRYRLQLLQDLVEAYPNNPIFIPKLTEQAAKEMGNFYTNKLNVDHTTKDEPINKPTIIELVAPDIK